MRDFVAVVLILGGFGLWLAATVALFRPLPRLYLKNRRQAGMGMALAAGLFVLGVIAVPSPAPAPAIATAEAAPTVADVPPPALTEAQQDGVSFIRLVELQARACSGALQKVQKDAAVLDAGKKAPIDVYEAAQQGVEYCRQTVTELNEKDIASDLPPAQQADATAAAAHCAVAVRRWRTALETVQTILDGDDRLATLAAFRAQQRDGNNAAVECRIGLDALARAMAIPESETSSRPLY